jgi:hypothetical protein
VDPLKLQELVRAEAGDLFDVCDTLPFHCKQAVLLSMVHVAKAVEESHALDGLGKPIDGANWALDDLMHLGCYLAEIGVKLEDPGAIVDQAIEKLIEYNNQRHLATDELSKLQRQIAELTAQLEAANSQPHKLTVVARAPEPPSHHLSRAEIEGADRYLAIVSPDDLELRTTISGLAAGTIRWRGVGSDVQRKLALTLIPLICEDRLMATEYYMQKPRWMGSPEHIEKLFSMPFDDVIKEAQRQLLGVR